MPALDLYYNEAYLDCGIRSFVQWEIEREPHAICVGGTGSGKTYATLLALARLSMMEWMTGTMNMATIPPA